MKSLIGVAVVVLVMLGLFAGQAGAAAITVVNSGFELPGYATNDFSVVPGWSEGVDRKNGVYDSAVTPKAGTYYASLEESGSLCQTSSYMIVVGEVYTLTVDGWIGYTDGLNDEQIQLDFYYDNGGSRVQIASTTQTVTATTGSANADEFTLTFSAVAGEPYLGKILGIEIINPLPSGNYYLHVDEVALDAAPPVVNSGFELPGYATTDFSEVPGWSEGVDRNNGVSGNAGTPKTGTYYAYLEESGSLCQTSGYTIVVGEIYTLTVDGWIGYTDGLNDEQIQLDFYYDNGGSRVQIASTTQTVTATTSSENANVFTLGLTTQPGQTYLGKRLGIEIINPVASGNYYINVDQVALTARPMRGTVIVIN